MLWLDNFIFNGEEAGLYRVKYLYDYVEKFYICKKEGNRGDIFEPYLYKIEFIELTVDRNSCVPKILADYPDTPFLLTVCEADEIPDLEVMKTVKEGLYNRCAEGCIYMEMKTFYYNLNWIFESKMPMSFVVNDILLKENGNLEAFRDEKGPIFGTFECGWKFAYFMSVADIHRIANSNLEIKKENIMESIINGTDFLRGCKLIKNKEKGFPKEILELNRAVMKALFGV